MNAIVYDAFDKGIILTKEKWEKVWVKVYKTPNPRFADPDFLK